jgi:hypothetical protein
MPVEGSKESQVLNDARSRATLPVLYPCQLPAGETLLSGSVTGDRGRQQAELVFGGPFDLRLRQSQYPPPRDADPTGASQSVVRLFPNVQGTLVERNDGSTKALYHLFWVKDGLYYEVQAVGPPLGRDYILQVATSLSANGLTPAQQTPVAVPTASSVATRTTPVVTPALSTTPPLVPTTVSTPTPTPVR